MLGPPLSSSEVAATLSRCIADYEELGLTRAGAIRALARRLNAQPWKIDLLTKPAKSTRKAVQHV